MGPINQELIFSHTHTHTCRPQKQAPHDGTVEGEFIIVTGQTLQLEPGSQRVKDTVTVTRGGTVRVSGMERRSG